MFLNLQHLATVLLAQNPAGPAQGAGGCADGNTMLLPLLMMAILYVVWFLPMRKERKQHQLMIDQLKRGDEVVTSSGIIGTVSDIVDKTVTIETTKNVKVRILKSAISKNLKVEEVKATSKSEDKSEAKASASKESKASKT
jgi:preprotein translocase subunit YajC